MEEGTSAPPESAKRGVGAAVVVVVAIVVFVAGFVGGLFSAPLVFPGPEAQQLRMGTILGKTGGLSAFGPNNEQGALLAVEQINEAGGVFDQDILMWNEDSQTLPDVARDVANKLVTTNRVTAIVGATGSGNCLTVIEVAKANDVFQMSGSCTSPIFSDPVLNGGWFARTAPSDALQGVVAGHYAKNVANFNNMAVIGINNPYGTGLADIFASTFETLGGTITKNQIVTEVGQGALTYIPDLDAVFATSPEAIYLVAYPPDAVLMYQEYFEGAYPAIQWIFSEGVFDQSNFIDELVSRNVDVSDFLGTAPGAFGGITGPRFDTWAADYEARWGNAPGLFDDNVYDATFLIALAAQAAGDSSGASIRDNIPNVANPPGTTILPGEWEKALTELGAGRAINYEGASGAADLDEFGDPVNSAYVVWAVDANDALFNLQVFDEDEVQTIVDGLAPSGAPPAQVASGLVIGLVEWFAPFRNN